MLSRIGYAISAVALALFSLINNVSAQEADAPTVPNAMHIGKTIRGWYSNPDGSCVQCSIGMAGANNNDPNAASVLWDTQWGPAIHGGSNPSRVANYCNSRGIRAWNVTGWPNTKAWMLWSAKTGRFAAIGAGGRHFQTLFGYVPGDPKPWKVCNNNSTSRINEYTDAQFDRLHLASGPWCVVLQRSTSEAPQVIDWWSATQ